METPERPESVRTAKTSTSPKPTRGATDPLRRQRIARAAYEVVAERGVRGLRHRVVAEAAGVPLGSTTYYFATLDDILEAAMREGLEANRVRLLAWARELPLDVDLAQALAELAEQSTGPDRAQLRVEYELYLAAIEHPSLQAVSRAWSDVLVEALSLHTDPVTAKALAALDNGLQLESLISGDVLLAAQVGPIYRRVLTGAA